MSFDSSRNPMPCLTSQIAQFANGWRVLPMPSPGSSRPADLRDVRASTGLGLVGGELKVLP